MQKSSLDGGSKSTPGAKKAAATRQAKAVVARQKQRFVASSCGTVVTSQVNKWSNSNGMEGRRGRAWRVHMSMYMFTVYTTVPLM